MTAPALNEDKEDENEEDPQSILSDDDAKKDNTEGKVEVQVNEYSDTGGESGDDGTSSKSDEIKVRGNESGEESGRESGRESGGKSSDENGWNGETGEETNNEEESESEEEDEKDVCERKFYAAIKQHRLLVYLIERSEQMSKEELNQKLQSLCNDANIYKQKVFMENVEGGSLEDMHRVFEVFKRVEQEVIQEVEQETLGKNEAAGEILNGSSLSKSDSGEESSDEELDEEEEKKGTEKASKKELDDFHLLDDRIDKMREELRKEWRDEQAAAKKRRQVEDREREQQRKAAEKKRCNEERKREKVQAAVEKKRHDEGIEREEQYKLAIAKLQIELKKMQHSSSVPSNGTATAVNVNGNTGSTVTSPISPISSISSTSSTSSTSSPISTSTNITTELEDNGTYEEDEEEDDEWECGCCSAFKGTLVQVQIHEKICSFRSLSDQSNENLINLVIEHLLNFKLQQNIMTYFEGSVDVVDSKICTTVMSKLLLGARAAHDGSLTSDVGGEESSREPAGADALLFADDEADKLEKIVREYGSHFQNP